MNILHGLKKVIIEREIVAELKCGDGTIVQISAETEAELRKVFGGHIVPHYKDSCIEVIIDPENDCYPIFVNSGVGVTRDVEDINSLIVALQEAVAYCEQGNLGV